jgi:hypothetical protein
MEECAVSERSICNLHSWSSSNPDKACPRCDSNEKVIQLLANWVHEFGADLIPLPPRADTYGEGIRAAKAQVQRIIERWRSV